VRTLGTSLLASAGIVGLDGSLAARPTVENLVAGLQIGLTEPFRIDDVVIAEAEWGWIEEINTTYVVVRTWDQRRLILPIYQEPVPELDAPQRGATCLCLPRSA
jgi:small-conductance mechanosensitive channel